MQEDPTKQFQETPDTGELTTDRKLDQIYTALTRLADEFSAHRLETNQRFDRLENELSEFRAETNQRFGRVEKDLADIKRGFRHFKAETEQRLSDVEDAVEDLQSPKH